MYSVRPGEQLWDVGAKSGGSSILELRLILKLLGKLEVGCGKYLRASIFNSLPVCLSPC